MPRRKTETQGIPQGTLAVSNVRAKKQTKNETLHGEAGQRSDTAARSTRQRVEICQNIIGRSVPVFRGRDRGRGGGVFGVHSENRALALLDQPASKHGRGVFLEILIQQFGDFLAEIGGVGQARKLVRLERGAGSGEKEFPGSLGTELRHEVLRSEEFGECVYIYTTVIDGKDDARVHGLWKSVEKRGGLLRACSACPGDYEDPDWSVWEEDEDEDFGAREGRKEEGDE